MWVQLVLLGILGASMVDGACEQFSCAGLGTANCEEEAVYEADPCDCTSYWICYECQQFHQQCPDGMIWNNHTQTCGYDTNYNCWATTFYPTGTNIITMATTAVQDPSIFMAARDQPLTQPEVIVRFPLLMANHGLDYNLLTSIYTVPRFAVYVFIYGCGTRKFVQTNFGLRTSNLPLTDIYNSNTGFNGHTSLGRVQVHFARRGEIFYTQMALNTQLFSSVNREAYFGGFELDKTMHYDAGFSAGLTSPLNTTGTLLYDVVNFDNLNGYNPFTGAYQVQYPGMYFVSVTAGVPAISDAKLRLESNRNGRLFDAMTTANNNNGPRMCNNAMMFYFLEHDLINLILDQGQLYADFEQQTSINLFLYDPRHIEASAWSVYTIHNWTATTMDLNPFPYKQSNVNHHGLYNFADHKVHVVLRGLYFIHINCGSVPGTDTYMQLHVGEVRGWVAGATHNVTNSDGWMSFGRDMIVELFASDEVYTRLLAGDSVHSGVYLPTTFTGFLLYQIR